MAMVEKATMRPDAYGRLVRPTVVVAVVVVVVIVVIEVEVAWDGCIGMG